jgi:ribonuclease R
MADFADRVARLVAEPVYKPITLKAMARQFEVSADEYTTFRAAVKGLVKSGKLDLAKDKTLRQPQRSGLVVGLFRRNAKGFGFVRPHTSTTKSEHIYIPPEATRDASSGDEVAVKITRRSRRDGMNHEGQIVEIVARASGIFVGTYFEAGQTSFVTIDGTTFR